MRPLLLIVAFALALQAQQAAPPDRSKPLLQVQGVALDKDSRQPVAGADVIVSATGAPASRGTTGDAGNFQVAVGSTTGPITVSVQAVGYQPGVTRVASISAGQASVYVEVSMPRMLSLTGRLVDDETREPLAGVDVSLVSYPRGMGKPASRYHDRAVTDADGRFLIKDLFPVDARLRISAPPAATIREIPAKELAGDNRDKALEVPEGPMSYGATMWPPSSTETIKIGSSPVNVGEIRLTKSRLHNLSALVGSCEDGAMITVTLSHSAISPLASPLATEDIPCGTGFQILNIPDGTFTLYAAQESPKQRWVSQTIGGLTPSPLRLNLPAFVSVQIIVGVEGGAIADLPASLKLSLTPRNPALQSNVLDQVSPGVYAGTFYPGEHYSISALSQPNYYVKRTFYGGSGQLDSDGFTVSSAPLSQLSIALSNHAASVQARVTSGGNPASGVAFLIRDGTSAGEISRRLVQYLRGLNPAGVATFTGLAPGTYRVAVPKPGAPVPTTEDALQTMLTDISRQSSAVTVDEGQTAVVNLDLP